MERKKQGFFSALKDEVVRGLSPGRSRPKSPARAGSMSPGFLRRKKEGSPGSNGFYLSSTSPETEISRSVSLGGALAPLVEGPDLDGNEIRSSKRIGSGLGLSLSQLVKMGRGQGSAVSSPSHCKRSDLRLLLGVMGVPLAPVHVSAVDPLPFLCVKDTPIETSSAQYILHQYTAATGVQKLENSIKSAYAMGTVKMLAVEFETQGRVLKKKNPARDAESGGFVLWKMNPDMWYVELSVGGCKVFAGCNGKLVWRHTPWLGAHTARGPVRPLRRAVQGLDPRTTAALFANAKCVGEKRINGEDCFILRLDADSKTLKARSEGPAEMVRHMLLGYFSQKTGLLVHIEDSHLTRVQMNGGDTVYWETTINSSLDDYRAVEGIMIAHSGRSIVTLYRFGEVPMNHMKTKMEESWTIEEVGFNIQGLSVDCFIPPTDLRSGPLIESSGYTPDEKAKNAAAAAVPIDALCSKVAALGRGYDFGDNEH